MGKEKYLQLLKLSLVSFIDRESLLRLLSANNRIHIDRQIKMSANRSKLSLFKTIIL